MTTTPDTATLRALEAAATPPPWGVVWGNRIVRGLEITGPGSYRCISPVAEMFDEADRQDHDEHPEYVHVDPEADANLIAAVRNALPALLDALAAAERERDEARETRDALYEQIHGPAGWAPESKRLGDFANAKVQELAAAKTARSRIAEAHSKHVDEHGGTCGQCNECAYNWPCPTYVWATADRNLNACWDPADDEPMEASDVL